MNTFKIEISAIRTAEQTGKAADPDVMSTDTIDSGLSFTEACDTAGHIRKITVNGTCYVQMCCGGQWQFFYKDVGGRRVWCTCSLGETWTVSCSGNNWMIGCF